MYNPYGNQRQDQGPYGANQNPDRDSSILGYPFNLPGTAASANPQSSFSVFPQQTSTRPDQTSHFSAPQRNDFYSSFTSSYSAPSSSAQPPSRASDTDSSIDGSLSWLRDISQSTSAKQTPSSSSSRKSNTAYPAYQNYPYMDDPAPNYPSSTKNVAETAVDILKQYNLEKEDLDQLMAYPENELTPDNLPFILHQIHLEKIQKKSTASTSTHKPPLPERSGFNSDSWTDSNCGYTGKTVKGAGTTSGFAVTGATQGLAKNSTDTKESAPSTATATTSVPTKRTSRWGPELPTPSYPTAYPMSFILSKKQAKRLRAAQKSKMHIQVRTQSQGLRKGTPMQLVPICLQMPTPKAEVKEETQSVENPATGPPQNLMLDYIAATPKSFPHTCTMCDKECRNMKEWISHQNDPVHIQSCKQFTKKYAPDWNSILGSSIARNVTKSRSRSPSSQRQKTKSRSRSPVRRRNRHAEDGHSSPRRNDDQRTSPQRGKERRYSPKRRSPSRSPPSRFTSSRRSPSTYSSSRLSPSRHTSARQTSSRCSPSRYSNSRSSPSRLSSSRYSPQRCTLPRHSPSRLTPPRGHDRRQWGERDEQRSLSWTRRETKSTSNTRSTSRERDEPKQSTRKTAETSSVMKSLSKIEDVDALVETVIPKLMLRMAKEMGNTSAQKKTVCEPTTMVTLAGITHPLTQENVMAVVKQFGKIKSVSMIYDRHEAKVHFEKEEDARNLRKATDLQIEGLPILIKEEDSALMKPLKSTAKSTKSSMSKTAPAQDSDSEVTEPAPSESSMKSDPVTDEPMEETSKSGPKPDLTKKVSSLSKEPEVSFHTLGERLDQILTVNTFKSLVIKPTEVLDHIFFKGDRTQVLLTDLPVYDPERPYTEDDLVKRLKPFRFQHEPNNLYILPQCRMAFVTMPDTQATQNLVRNFTVKPESNATFGDSTMTAYVLPENCFSFVTPHCFYISLMRLCKHTDVKPGDRLIYITNISDGDAAILKKRLEKIQSVRNYMPLLNKVFVEFMYGRDADRLGVYHSLLSTAPSYEINRITHPMINHPTWPPVHPANAMPDETERVPGVAVLADDCEMPLDSGSQFWVTLNSKPFLFPTRSPWFVIPDFTRLTLESLDETQNRTVMLTGLPLQTYSMHRVLERTLSTGNSYSRHYNIIVLPLQRRAFINFPTAEACADFCKRNLTKKPTIRNNDLTAHYVNDTLFPVSCEEEVYRTFMKLSNNRAPMDLELEQRLVRVSVKEYSLDLIRLVMEVVTSAVPILGFLPLANRICIEVPNVSDVDRLRKKFSQYKPEPESQLEYLWSKVLSLDTSAEFKERLKERLKNREIALRAEWSPVRTPSEKSDNSSADPNITSRKDKETPRDDKEKKPAVTKRRSAAELEPKKAKTKDYDRKESQAPRDATSRRRSSVKDVPDSKTANDALEEASESPEPESGVQPLLTFGDILDVRLTNDVIDGLCLELTTVMGPNFHQVEHLALCNLPEYDPQDPYTEAELVEKLEPFGFLNDYNDIYVVPQCRMAFVMMPDYHSVVDLVSAFVKDPLGNAMFRGCQLKPRVFAKRIPMNPWGFYVWLLSLAKHKRPDNCRQRTVFISNIKSDVAECRKKLASFGSVANYLPLLNKVFVEFKTNTGADRLGVYHSLLDRPPSYEITRMDDPSPKHLSNPPTLVFKAVPGVSERAPGVTVPQASPNQVLPMSQSPFFVTMAVRSFMFPTDSPWFSIPEFETLPSLTQGQPFCESNKTTIMLTNLPFKGYQQECIYNLVLPFLRDKSLHSFYYDVIVLPQQRRAFIHLQPENCAKFAEKYYNDGLSLEGMSIQAHYIDCKMFPLSSEEEMYETFMRMSNSRAPMKHELGQRLLCVFVSRFTFDLVQLVMEVVTSAAPIFGFLPLGNRICIELRKISDVIKVRKKFHSFKPEDKQERLWRRVQSMELAAEVQQRVERSGSAVVDPKSTIKSSYHLDMGKEDLEVMLQSCEQSISSSGQNSNLEKQVEVIQEFKKDVAKKPEEAGGEGIKITDDAKHQNDSNENTESCRDLHLADESTKSSEESFQTLDSVKEIQNKLKSVDKKLPEKDPNQETRTSQSGSVSENVGASEPETRSKRKREKGDAETKEVCSKTVKKDDQDGNEQEPSDIVASVEGKTTTEDLQKDDPKDEKLNEKDELNVIEEEESKKRVTRSRRSGPNAEKEKSPKRKEATSKSKTPMKEATVECKSVDLVDDEATQEKFSVRRHSARGKREKKNEALDPIEDATRKSKEGIEGKGVADTKILESVEGEGASISEKARVGKKSTSHSLNKESTASKSEEMDSVEVQARPSRQTRSSQRDQSSSSLLKRNTPTRRGRSSAKETKQDESEESTMKVLTKVDVPEAVEEEARETVEEEPTPSLKTRKGRRRKQPQKTATKSDEKVKTPGKKEDDVQESEKQNEEAVSMEISEEHLSQKVVEEPDEPMCEVLDLLKEGQIQDEQIVRTGETTETFEVDIDTSTEDNTVRNSEEIRTVQTQKKAVEMDKEIVESQKEASAITLVERKSSEGLDDTAKQISMEKQEQFESLSDQKSKELEDKSEVAVLEAEKMERRTTRKTRSVKSGKVCEEIAQKQRMSRRLETKQVSTSEPQMEKASSKTAEQSSEDSGILQLEEVNNEKQVLELAEDETEIKDQEQPPEVAVKRRGRPCKQPRKSASKSCNVKAYDQPAKEGQESKIREDKMEDVTTTTQQIMKSDVVEEEVSKNEDKELIHEVLDTLKDDQVLSETMERFKDDQSAKEDKGTSKLGNKEDAIKKKDVEEAEVATESKEKHTGNVELREETLEATKAIGTNNLEKAEEVTTKQLNTEVHKLLENHDTLKDKKEDGQDQKEPDQAKSLEAGAEATEEERGASKSTKRKHGDGTVDSKQRTNVEVPDTKRCRPAPSDAALPPFRPNNPVGQEYVVPRYGFFCDLCRVFYLNESMAREQHCSSRRHYDNLKKLLEKRSRGDAQV